MATAGTERQSRLCVILVKVGTPVATAVFEKRVKDLTPANHSPSTWTVDEFLLANKPKIRSLKLHSKNWSNIFPLANLQIWDLALLCIILIECCDLPPNIRLDIEELRKSRNKLFHMNEPSIDDQKYQHYLMKFEVIFGRCLNEINDEVFTTEVNRMVKDLEQGNSTQEDAEYVKQMLQSMQEENGQNHRSTHEKLDELLRNVAVLTTSSESANKLKVPESGAKIEVRNCSSETENDISKLMVQCFEECIDSNDVGLSECSLHAHAKCKEAVYKMYTKLLSKGYKVTGIQKGCVFLHVQCSSLASLMSYFQDYISGQLAFELKEVEDTIRQLDGCEDIALEIVINNEEILKTVDLIVSELMKTKGTLTQTAAAEIQANGKTTETNCADQGIQDYTAEFQSLMKIKIDQQSGRISKLMINERPLTQTAAAEIQAKGKTTETDCVDQGIKDDTAEFQSLPASKIDQHSVKSKQHLHEYTDTFANEHRVYWMKAMKGLSSTKDIVLPLVTSTFRNFIANCTVYERDHIKHLLKMASNRNTYKQVFFVRQRQPGPDVWYVNCPECKPLLRKLLQAHLQPSRIEWENIGDKSVEDFWKIAKLFLPYGNKNSMGPEDTDMLATFELLRNFKIDNFNEEMKDLDQLIRDRNELIHLSSNEIPEEKMNEIFSNIFKFLKSERLGEGNTMDARKEIEELQKKMVFDKDELMYMEVCLIQQMGLKFDEHENERRDKMMPMINEGQSDLGTENFDWNNMKKEIKELSEKLKMKNEELNEKTNEIETMKKHLLIIKREYPDIYFHTRRTLVAIETGQIVGRIRGASGGVSVAGFSYPWDNATENYTGN